MVGLTLSGGGVKGSYQIGSYLAFKKCGIKFRGITGTSIGAFNGALIACDMEDELLDFWLNVDVGKLLGFGDEYIKKAKLNKKDVEYYLLKIDTLIDVFKNKGISVDNLEKVLQEFNLEEKLRKKKIDFGLSTLRLKDTMPLNLFMENIPKGSLNNYIIASCYLPIFKQKKLDDDSYFLDGGVHNYCPINMLLEKGYKKVYAVDLRAIGISQIVTDKSKVIYIKPTRKLSPMITLDKELIKENIQMGYYDTLRILKKYDGKHYCFKRRSNLYYKHITSKVSNQTMAMITGYLGNKTPKKLVITAFEMLLKKDKKTYYDIYDIKKLIKEYQSKEGSSILLRFIKELH